jgi:hypothetical protein
VVADPGAAGAAALAAGRWDEARTAFESSIAEAETAPARFGLATALCLVVAASRR